MDYVLVHGTTQSPRGWLRLTTHLESRGHRVAAVDLPTDRPEFGAADYAAIVREQVQGTVTAPVVVAHSGSGALLHQPSRTRSTPATWCGSPLSSRTFTAVAASPQ
jgi:pimeloyl-ACP methyl ester carboxylesterase